MSFKNENTTRNLNVNDLFQEGVSNVDQGLLGEENLSLPWTSDPAGSYAYYECTVMCVLDSGIVVHNRLPQVNNSIDTLSSVDMNSADLDRLTTIGVNLACRDQYQDIVQRMGHARYWFRLWGQGLRIGYKIPIPGIKTIGGVPAIPYDKNPQWAFNRIFPGGNYGGIPLWHAKWSLWYTVIVPPNKDDLPCIDLAAQIRGTDKVPNSITPPFTLPDDNSVPTQPGTQPSRQPSFQPIGKPVNNTGSISGTRQ